MSPPQPVHSNMMYCVSQLQVRAIDLGEPAYEGFGRVQINVNRNPSGPRFLLDPYFNTVHESTAIGGLLFNTTAVDLDGVSSVLYFSEQERPP